ncbi:MAG: ATP-binding protein [Blastocatellia bacterium]
MTTLIRSRATRYAGLLLALVFVPLLAWPGLIRNLFAANFMPHIFCLSQEPSLVSLYVASNLAIGLSYIAISLTLVYFVVKKRGLPFHWMFLAFGLFIIACGATHFMDVLTLWNPVYWLEGGVSLITAVASVTTAVLLPPMIPQALALPSPAELLHANEELEREIAERKRAETILRESEERYRAVIQQASEGIFIFDADTGQVVEANPALARLLGYTPGAISGLTIYDIVADDRTVIHRNIQRVVTNRLHIIGERQYRRADGSIIDVEVSANHITLGKDVVCAVVRDITERKQAEQQRLELAREQAARAEAEAANRSKDEFLATVSHELRTPLNAILGWSRMLRTSALDVPTRERALEVIERNAKAQSQLIEDLLDVSRIITGKLRLAVGPVNLASVIEYAIESMRPAIDAKNITLQVVLESDSSVVSGDAERLQQVVWNLLSNAVKFTPKGGSIRAQLRRVNSHVEITVSDTGKGIALEFLPYVFDRFRQADSSLTRAFGGLGLGLAIVRHLIELHGGTVQAHSDGEGEGATFTIRLPMLAMHEAGPSRLSLDAFQRATGRPLAFEQAASLAGLTVMVLDDEPDARLLLTTILREQKAEVTAVASVEEAFAALPWVKPDIIVSDIGMPREDGYSFIRRLRALEAEQGEKWTPAIALTAHARDGDRLRALAAGFQSHIAKPADPLELVTVIFSLVGRNAAG